ncbi:hypothetical protein MKW98_031250 [Papaver atlanticum]|uniref:Uncharacterized protein n=1 Tax=Papaver atlanticum TaxID=357466 RepID=A0AAD4S5H8_9MAGN|nr:hypothetical protein MKW98_031250 [Papaver atlanticum]
MQKCDTIAKRKKKSKNKEYQRWMASWCKGTGRPPKSGPCSMDYHVCTDGYFRPGRKGGHGVIIRDNVGKPVVASAFTSTEAKSFLYHQVKALAVAVELAVEYSLEDIQLFCNAKHVARLVNSSIGSATGCTEHSSKHFDVICKRCMKDLTKSDYELVFPLLRSIAAAGPKFDVPLHVVKVPRDLNRAADYLAKNGEPGMEVLSPSGLPDELKEILCEDYVESDNYGLPCCTSPRWLWVVFRGW